MIYDLHVHTNFSDGKMSVKEALEAAERQDIGISIVDHNEIRGSIEGYRIARKREIPFVCGIELGTREGKELLLYFNHPRFLERFFINEVEQYRTARMTRIDRTMESFLSERLKKKYEIALVTIPHPCAIWFKNIQWNPELSNKMIEFCDAMEVVNSQMRRAQNFRALCAAICYDKYMTSGSDAHLVRDVGKALTWLTSEDGNLIPETYFGRRPKWILGTLYQIIHSNIRYTCNEHYQTCIESFRMRRKPRKKLTVRF